MKPIHHLLWEQISSNFPVYGIWLGGTPAKPRMQISLIKGGKVGYAPIKLTCQWKIIILNWRSINMNNELKINDSYNPWN